jgi:hypothetical protein
MQTPGEKDLTIRQVLTRLEADLGPRVFVLADHWEQDLMAVGIACPLETGRLVYISTYRSPPGRYDVELELPPEPGSDSLYSNAGRFDSVEYETLREIITTHLASGEAK